MALLDEGAYRSRRRKRFDSCRRMYDRQGGEHHTQRNQYLVLVGFSKQALLNFKWVE